MIFNTFCSIISLNITLAVGVTSLMIVNGTDNAAGPLNFLKVGLIRRGLMVLQAMNGTLQILLHQLTVQFANTRIIYVHTIYTVL